MIPPEQSCSDKIYGQDLTEVGMGLNTNTSIPVLKLRRYESLIEYSDN